MEQGLCAQQALVRSTQSETGRLLSNGLTTGFVLAAVALLGILDGARSQSRGRSVVFLQSA